MKNFVGSLLSLVACAGTFAWAVPETQYRAGVRRIIPLTELEAVRDYTMSGIYSFDEDVELVPLTEMVDGFFNANPASETLSFNAGEPVSIEFDEMGNAMIHLLLVEEEKGVIPEMVYVTAAELLKANLTFIKGGDEDILNKEFSPYEDTEEAARRGFNRKGRLHYRGAYGCVAYVVRAIGWRGPIGNGHKVTSTLMKHGWKRLKSCKNPPVGTIASWSGGSHGLGHTAIWNGKGWCYDKGCHDPGRKYKFLNCVHK